MTSATNARYLRLQILKHFGRHSLAVNTNTLDAGIRAGEFTVDELRLMLMGDQKVIEVAAVDDVFSVDLNGGLDRNFTLSLADDATLVVSDPAEVGFVTEFDLLIEGNGHALTLPESFVALGASPTEISEDGVTLVSVKSFDGVTFFYAMQYPAAVEE